MATIDWIGGALAVAQVTRVTYSAYTSGQTYTLTINAKSISYVAAASTSADVWAGLVAAWLATTIAEFKEATASVSSGVLLTGVTAGLPFTVTGSATGGITATVASVTAPTGPNSRTNAANWLGGVAPVAADKLRFRNGNISMLYDLVDVATNFSDIIIEASYGGAIGLPANNGTYTEYRPRFLKLGDGTNSYIIRIGQGQGSQPTRVLIDANAATVLAQIYGSGQIVGGERPIVIKNTDASSTFEVYGGYLSLDGDSSGSAATLKLLASASSGIQCDVLTSETFACGVITCLGGKLEVRGSATSLTAGLGAVVSIAYAATCPIVVAASGATVYWDSTAGITTSATAHSGGTVDFSRNANPKTVAASTCHKDGRILDPAGILTLTTGVLLSGCTNQECTVDIGRNRTLKT